jgi:hypothetical protein
LGAARIENAAAWTVMFTQSIFVFAEREKESNNEKERESVGENARQRGKESQLGRQRKQEIENERKGERKGKYEKN